MNSAGLQQAIYTRLAGYVPLTSQLSSVGIRTRVVQPDDAGDDSLYPYVTFGIPSAIPFDDKDVTGGNSIIQIHTWSRSQSELVRRAIEDSIYDCLNRFGLVISSAQTTLVNFVDKTELDDPDGVTTHGVLNFRVLYQEA